MFGQVNFQPSTGQLCGILDLIIRTVKTPNHRSLVPAFDLCLNLLPRVVRLIKAVGNAQIPQVAAIQ